MTAASIVVPAALAGDRLDRVVALLSGRTRAEVAHLVEAGGVQVGGIAEHRRSRRLVAGEEVRFDLSALPEAASFVRAAEPGSVAFKVCSEDADFLIVDKPVGVVTHPGAGQAEGTLVNGLLARYPELALLPDLGCGTAERPGIVHRLDKETSGLLAVARSETGFRSLSAQLADRSLGRTYRALVSGLVGPEQGIVDAPIGRSGREPTRMAVTSGGRAARTRYVVLQRYSGPVPASELEVRLETGRTHQIRVHLAAIGHPVLGDSRYGRQGAARASRLMLHAERLSLMHPRTGDPMVFESSLPDDFAGDLERFSLLE